MLCGFSPHMPVWPGDVVVPMIIFVGIIQAGFQIIVPESDRALIKKTGKKGLAQAYQTVTAPLPAVQEDHNGKGYNPDNDDWIFYHLFHPPPDHARKVAH